ncbi:hypothetical protein EMIHUDRAFT_116600 [Emiliania huxleyi CCMP1516]|uniref:Uncharacterized protein n=2 Tax=Emiliania huxleyi TaxID=2903 RepID=A0A0D3JGM7_EMIH1|nr:hypothetical protein EMIHUDRAFT_116600 [Emiliania huxleyi CCMP1516]EOD22662.1 hypothetical protein EMIHUDRAFT_116600 [Emiliania huxleyi CCMP1516]|eukprot:XP_005775091.1 hypothetical protein EMIHUDRAFT_116600 [Emiliania huxleyi CCMP1516]
MPALAAAELSIPAEQHPDPAKPLVIPVDSTAFGGLYPALHSVVCGMQPSWVQIPQWVAISALLPFSEPEPAVATYFDRLSVLRLAVLAAAWRRILGALSDLGVFGTALHSRQIPVPELYLQWGDLGYSEAIVPLGPVPSAEAKAVDFLQYATVGALCDPTADVPFAALSDMTRCLGPVFTAAARVDPMGSTVVGAASLAAAAGHITPRASDGHPALLARHVLSMLKATRSSFPACLRINSFQNYSAEVETRAEYVGGTTVARDRVAEQRCSRAIAAKAPTLDSLLRALPRPTPPSVVYEAYRQLVSLYFPTDRRPMDLLLTDLDAQLHARLPTYQHALTNGKPFASILEGLRKLHESLEPSRKAPVMASTGDSEDSALGKFDRAPAGLPDNSLREAIHSAPFQDAVRKIGSIDLSTPTGPLEVLKEACVTISDATSGRNDAAAAGLGGFCHGFYWRLSLNASAASVMHITLLEFAFGFIVFRRLLQRFPRVVFLSDAISTPYALSRESERSPLLRFAHRLLRQTEAFGDLAPRASVAHLSEDANAFSDAVSRALWPRLDALARQLGLRLTPMDLPEEARYMPAARLPPADRPQWGRPRHR